jgi:D-amino peptidase
MESVKAFISCDMEGLPFTVSNEHGGPGKMLYDETRTIMTECMLSVVEELNAAGVKQIVVADAHGPMVNLLPGRMPKGVSLVRGTPRSHSMVAGASGCDFAIFIGSHAKPDTAMATFDHTISSSALRKVKVNGIEMSEFLLNAAYLGEEGVPVVMVAGDKTLLDDDVSESAPWAVGVQLKESLGRYSAISPSMVEIDEQLKEGTKKALLEFKNHRTKLFRLKTPAQVELMFQSSAFADIAGDLPGAKRLDGSRIRFTSPTIGDVLNTIKLLVFASIGVRSATE